MFEALPCRQGFSPMAPFLSPSLQVPVEPGKHSLQPVPAMCRLRDAVALAPAGYFSGEERPSGRHGCSWRPKSSRPGR
jgi:hypothetical protein